MIIQFLPRRWLGSITAIFVLGAALHPSNGAFAESLTIFAAVSTKNAMDEIAVLFHEKTGHDVVLSFAGSSALAMQISHGAPADIFLSANPGWMDVLETEGLLERQSRFDLLSNSIVLVAHGADAAPLDIGPDMGLAGMLGDNRMAMALVEAVPAGIYGKAALNNLGIWKSVEQKIAQADNVRAALLLVSSGETPLGIVYASDAIADDRVTVVGTFPSSSHPPIVYPVAALSSSNNPLNAGFLQFLRGPVARNAFMRHGFGVSTE